MLVTKRKIFYISQDETDYLAGDNELGSLGTGRYRIWAKSTAADSTISVSDGSQLVLNAVPIPVGAAEVTYPKFERDRDIFWEVNYNGRGPNIPINIVDGTTGKITLVVEKLG